MSKAKVGVFVQASQVKIAVIRGYLSYNVLNICCIKCFKTFHLLLLSLFSELRRHFEAQIVDFGDGLCRKPKSSA